MRKSTITPLVGDLLDSVVPEDPGARSARRPLKNHGRAIHRCHSRRVRTARIRDVGSRPLRRGIVVQEVRREHRGSEGQLRPWCARPEHNRDPAKIVPRLSSFALT